MINVKNNKSSKKLDSRRESSKCQTLFNTLWKLIDRRMKTLANNCSMHGMNWYAKIKSPWLKALCFLALHITVVLVSWFVLKRVIVMYSELSNESATQKHKIFAKRNFPNLTICHPQFFDHQLISGICHKTQLYMN